MKKVNLKIVFISSHIFKSILSTSNPEFLPPLQQVRGEVNSLGKSVEEATQETIQVFKLKKLTT